MEKISFFHADYRDGRVSLGGKTYPAGTFAVLLLNQFYENDTAARIAVFISSNRTVQAQLSAGYINASDFVRCAWEIGHSLEAVAVLQPFTLMDTDGERNRAEALFTEETADRLSDYFRRRGKVAAIDEGAAALGVLPQEYDRSVFEAGEALLSDVRSTLAFYESLGDDVIKVHQSLLAFMDREDGAERLDEVHLLPIAMDVFKPAPSLLRMEYVSVRKNKGSKADTVARRLYFESYYSFVVTDFFEGLHYGHYPRRCEVCRKYFLMQSAARQRYCNGYAPFKLKGRAVTCKNYGARIKRKELAENDPVTRIYKNRRAAIRVGQQRGELLPEFAEEAKTLAKERMQRAKADPEYANGQYLTDMSREKLYRDVDRKMNG